jgi:hypothetical protein
MISIGQLLFRIFFCQAVTRRGRELYIEVATKPSKFEIFFSGLD